MRKRLHSLYSPPSHGLHRNTLLLLIIIITCSVFLGACGSWRLSQLWEKPSEGPSGAGGPTTGLSHTVESACPLPQTPLEAPDIPPALRETPHNPVANAEKEESLPYTARFHAPKLSAALAPLQKQSLLLRLAATPPVDLMGLDFRISKDEHEARNIMQSLGYYSARVHTEVDTDKKPVLVTMELEPGPLYSMGETNIHYAGHAPPKAPKNLYELGLPAQSPATADTVLESVDSLTQWLKAHGYPLARVEASHYYLDQENHRLDAEIRVAQGPLARMGKVIVDGSDSVNPDFINRLRPWKTGRVWNEDRVEMLRNELTEQGLFRSIRLEAVPPKDDSATTKPTPNELNTAPLYDVLLSVADSPQRTVGGGLNYESDRGIGGQAFWEHRNLLGEGERLRTELGLWEDRQNARINFTKPAFLQRGQAFTAETWLRSENTDAYDQQAAWAGVGIERRLNRHWWAFIKASAEGGKLRDPVHKRQGYTMFGLPVGIRFDNTNSLLDSSKGMRAKLSLTPYDGQYGKNFTALVTRVDSSAYLPLKGDNSIVLAARASAGSIMRDDALTVPASIRFYSGGGGSVRGYAYQSLGPRDVHDDPLGGASFLEMSVETRIKITESLGIVPFLDGGNAFEDRMPRPDKEALRWGAGLGLRYYTSIGPIRLDVATPLNPRKDDAPVFMYISIGQSF
ncbi:MAG: autotransporter assembly complex family protein [Desulfovibrionaceae bacterium]